MAQELALGGMAGLGTDALAASNSVLAGRADRRRSVIRRRCNEVGLREIEIARLATGIKITTVFCGFVGESYADIPTVRARLVLEAERVEKIKIACGTSCRLHRLHTTSSVFSDCRASAASILMRGAAVRRASTCRAGLVRR